MYGCFLDGSVHALDLAVGPRMFRLREAVVDVCLCTDILERMGTERRAVGKHLLNVDRGPAFAGGIGEVQAVIGKHGMDPVRYCGDEGAQEVA